MSMKKIIICLVAVLLCAGCDSLIEPNHIKDPEILGWVYRDCIDHSLAEKIQGNFIGDVRKHTLIVEGFESIGALEDEVINYFKTPHCRFIMKGTIGIPIIMGIPPIH